ncbi:MAG TPA: PP2C family protein-serine/threonine phosphatase [Tepidisphaeraceae bacterium]|jgi:sigma-B regulation protein RsbU (phosphoserine phosphatase)
MSAAIQFPDPGDSSLPRVEHTENPAASGTIARIIPPIEAELDRLQRDLLAVQQELEDLRQRDETLKFYTQRLDEELKLAARVQQDFLPKSMPSVGPLRFHTIYRPAGFVSGDLYDVTRLDESHVALYMADAVGHGMPAALLTMFLKNALKTKEILPGGYRLLSPGQALERLNDALVAQNLSQATFATAVYAVVDTKSLTLTLARAGHPSPIRLGRSGEMDAIEADGSLLGIFPDEKFSETTVQLSPGDRVFLFTDGVEVAFCGDRSLDTQQWREEILARRELETSALVSELAAKVDGGQLKDDLTMIVMDVG